MMASGGQLASTRQALDAGLQHCRLCYGVRVAYLHSLEPRWGGSWAAMERFVGESSSLVANNPKLALLQGATAAERCRLLSAEKNVGDGHAACNAALKYGDVASTLVYDAHLFVQERRNDEALARIERALRVDPQNSEALRIRQGLRIDLADYLGAARDLVLIRHLEPANERIAQRITWLVKNL